MYIVNSEKLFALGIDKLLLSYYLEAVVIIAKHSVYILFRQDCRKTGEKTEKIRF